MNNKLISRRHLLHLGAIGIATSLAGCADNELNGDPPGSNPDNRNSDAPEDDTDPDGKTVEMSDTPAKFHAPNITYPLYYLPEATQRPDPADMSIQHQDNTIFTITVPDSQTAKVTLEKTNVIRDIELRLHVRNANGNFKTVTKTLESTDTDSPDTHEIEFDISRITLPRNAGSICELVAIDDKYDPNHEFIIKRHQFVGITHESNVKWVNKENLNTTYHRPEDTERGTLKGGISGITGDIANNTRAKPAGHIEHEDGDDNRTVFLTTKTPYNNEIFGVACQIPHEPVQKYKTGSEKYQYRHSTSYEAAFATEINHFQEFAQTTYDTITAIGADKMYEKISILGDLIQMLAYIGQPDDPPPSNVLYDSYGDCSSKSILIACILMNEPWDIMPAYIRGTIGGVGHRTIAIDVRDIEEMPGLDSAFTVSPTDSEVSKGIPDTEWVFFDMTYDSSIGEKTKGVKDTHLYTTGDYATEDTRRSDNPPDY